MTEANRKAQRAFKDRQRQLGRKRVELWLTPEERSELIAMLAKLRSGKT